MKIKVLSKSDREIKFVIEGVNAQFANALRRISLSEVPVLAIDSVDFYHNDSVLYDEIIAHRLGSLPLQFDPKAFDMPDYCECEGEGCSNCSIVMVVDKKGPGMVYAKDIKSADSEAAKPLYPETPIVELFEGQRLKAEATAVLGLGKNHAKWNAGRAWYWNYPKINLTGSIQNPDEAVKVCPKNALSITGNKVTVTEACDLCGECAKVARPMGALKVGGEAEKFIFNIESVSGLAADKVLLSAVNILKKKAKAFEKEAGKL